MAALNLDSNESSQLCAQSLFVRSKPSPARTWLQKWKRDSWTQHLSGRILRPSHGQSFVTAWTSSLEVIPASHSAAQANVSEQMTRDICGPTSQTAFAFCDPESASLRTSRDTLALDSEKSLQTWKALVTKRRGEYSARRNASMQVDAQHRTSVNECSSWPTVTANEDSYRIGGNSQQSKCLSAMARRGEMFGPAAPANPSTHGSRPELLWPTHTNTGTGRVSDGKRGRDLESCITNPQAWSRPESWSTPTVTDASAMSPEMRPSRIATGRTTEYLARQIQWATPRTKDAEGWMMNQARLAAGKPEDTLTGQALQSNKDNGKLNPRWVETLMGLPVGWTMPSCASPVTIELTSCGCSATE
jgi:hypothetical protein